MMMRRTFSPGPTPALSLPQHHGTELTVILELEEATTIPNVVALGDISAKISTLAHEMMDLTFQRPEGPVLAEASRLLVLTGTYLVEIEELSSADQRVRASLGGARTALLTAVRELREHLIRHGWEVDHIAAWQAASRPVRDRAQLRERECTVRQPTRSRSFSLPPGTPVRAHGPKRPVTHHKELP